MLDPKYEVLRKALLGLQRFVQWSFMRVKVPSNNCRGEDGLPKTCGFGGSRRSYESGQGWKRTLKQSDQLEMVANIDPAFERPMRTRVFLVKLLQDAIGKLSKVDFRNLAMACICMCHITQGKSRKDFNSTKSTEEAVNKALKEVGLDDKSQADEPNDEGQGRHYGSDAKAKVLHMQLRLYSAAHLAELDRIVKACSGLKTNEMFDRMLAMLDESRDKIPLGVIEALYGNFSPGSGFKTVEAALSGGMAVSTSHLKTMDGDDFVAYDDLEGRAGHLNNRNFVSGTVYQAWVCDLFTFAVNLGDDTLIRAADYCATMMEICSVNTPMANKTSMLPRTFPFLCMATMTSQPITYLDAFQCSTLEHPVYQKTGDEAMASLHQLNKHLRTLDKQYSSRFWKETRAYVLSNKYDIELPGRRFETIDALAEWVRDFKIAGEAKAEDSDKAA